MDSPLQPHRPPAPAGAGVLGRHRIQGFAKSAHPWLCSLRSSGAEHTRAWRGLRTGATTLANLRLSFEVYKLREPARRAVSTEILSKKAGSYRLVGQRVTEPPGSGRTTAPPSSVRHCDPVRDEFCLRRDR